MKKTTLALAVLVLAIGCDAQRPPAGRDGGGGGGNADGSTMMSDARVPPRIDAGRYDPFDPRNACGVSTIPTERVPGSLLIVFDRSGSMSDPPGGGSSGPSKWELARTAINNVLASVSDELSAGLMLFPSDGDCGVPSTPNVPVAPLSTSRAQIASALASTGPGGNTPAFDALLAGYEHLNTLTTPGQRGVVLVTDGGETCSLDQRDAVLARVRTEHDANNRLTFAVGLSYADNNLSTIAYNGGTPRSSTCMPTCTSDSCLNDADCGGAPCVTLVPGVAGFCSCRNDSDCVGMQTCEPPPIGHLCLPMFPPGFCDALHANRCEGPTDCCHYNAAASDFQAQFEDALSEIARRLLDSCVFDVPRGTDPSMFDPALVNVGVTFEGEMRTVLPRSSDRSMDSWDYTDSSYETLVIQGPICERLLGGEPAVVEIVLGCPTILI